MTSKLSRHNGQALDLGSDLTITSSLGEGVIKASTTSVLPSCFSKTDEETLLNLGYILNIMCQKTNIVTNLLTVSWGLHTNIDYLRTEGAKPKFAV